MEPTEIIRSTMPLCEQLGITATEFSSQLVRLHLDWQPNLCTTAGVLHGGTLMALADSAGAACAFLNLPDGANGTTTIESKTNFMGAVTEGPVTATSQPLHVGGSTIVVETELHRDDGKLVAKTTQTQSVLWPRTR